MADDDSEDSNNLEPSSKRPKRNRRSVIDQSTRSVDISIEDAASSRTRQKNKQNAQQQLLAEQQRVEQRVQQEQMKLKQQKLMQQQQKEHEEKRQQQLRASSEDISNLRTNPNISMRELFPGEEDLGLSVNFPIVSGNDSSLFNLKDYNG